ncbi:MAG: phosphatase domain-containing protein [Bradymonadia bacterium]
MIEDKGHAKPSASRSRLKNLWNTARTLESDEIEDAQVELVIGRERVVATTDDDGVFHVDQPTTHGPLALGPQVVKARLIDDRGHPTPPTEDHIFVLGESPLILVSDFDDTVMHSGVTRKRDLLKNALLKNAAQLKPVAGAGAAYTRSLKGSVDAVVYLSGSPQNFITRIRAFLEINGLPPGAIILKNFGIGEGADPIFDQLSYKGARLEGLARAFPKARFILVGDAGEKDPEIYRAFARKHPQQVLKTVIRRVKGAAIAPDRVKGMHVIDDFTHIDLTAMSH